MTFGGKIAVSEYNKAKTLAERVSELVDIVPETNKLVTCGYVKDAFQRIQTVCDETIDSLKLLWVGNLILAISLFSVWVSYAVAINRLSNRDRLIGSMLTSKSLKDKFWTPDPPGDDLYVGETFERSKDGDVFKEYALKPVGKSFRKLASTFAARGGDEKELKIVHQNDTHV